MKVNAIIFGATGMVGEGVLHECLNHPEVEEVLVINRRPCGVVHDKLQETILPDFMNLSEVEKKLSGYNACYFCMGVSSIGMSEEAYRRITYDLTLHVANLLVKLNPEMTFCYVSGAGTDSSESGRSRWARVKGKTENDLMKLPFKGSYMFRPGYIQPIKGLKNTYKIYKVLSPLYPVFKKLFPKYVCTLQDLGRAMINVTRQNPGIRILENKEISLYGKRP
jgi:uncharacterized protein YbjT (DUF2867 family)